MVALSDKQQPSKTVVRSFERQGVKVSPEKSARHARDLDAARTWSSVSDPVAERFLQLARRNLASSWYTALTADQAAHWLAYYAEDASGDELSARRIPQEVTRALKLARKRDCFHGFLLRANEARRQYVLIGLLCDDNDQERLYPIIAWHPVTALLPTDAELARFYDEIESARTERGLLEQAARAAREAELRERAHHDKKRRELVVYYRGLFWRVQIMVAVIGGWAASMVAGWQASLLGLSTLAGCSALGLWLIRPSSHSHGATLKQIDTALRKRCWGVMAVVTVIAGVVAVLA